MRTWAPFFSSLSFITWIWASASTMRRMLSISLSGMTPGLLCQETMKLTPLTPRMGTTSVMRIFTKR